MSGSRAGEGATSFWQFLTCRVLTSSASSSSAADYWHNVCNDISPWARGGRRYHLREPHFNGIMLFRNMNCNYICLLDIPNSQLKPANLHKQNCRRPKRVLPYFDHSPYPLMHPSPRNVWDIFYFVHGTCLNMRSGYHHHQIWMDYLWDAIFKMAAIEKWPSAK